MTYETLKRDPSVCALIERADRSLIALGFTEHSFAHVGRVADVARYILDTLGYDPHEIELAQIAAHLHDIGNLVNRVQHSLTGATMAFTLLSHTDMPAEDIATVVTAIGNHDEGVGVPVNPTAAALILADKSDVRRSRVRCAEAEFDIHDRVNYSVESASLTIDDNHEVITLDMTIDTAYSSVMDYFAIFMERMVLCRKAAEFLGLRFMLCINGQSLM